MDVKKLKRDIQEREAHHREEMRGPLAPPVSLLCKLASIAAHAEEATSPSRHEYDFVALQGLLNDYEVKAWLKAMGPFVPVKR